jgi:uncharacterized protein
MTQDDSHLPSGDDNGDTHRTGPSGPEPDSRHGQGDVRTRSTANSDPWDEEAPADRRSGPPRDFRVPWTWADWVMGPLFTLFFGAAFAATVVGLMGLDPLGGGRDLVFVGVLTQVSGLAGFLVWLAARGSLTRHLLGYAPPRARHLGYGLAAGVGGYVGFVAYMTGMLQLIGIDDLPRQESLLGIVEGEGLVLVLGFVMVVVLAPLVEELVYRGVIFQGMRQRWGFWLGALLSAGIFAVVHLELLFSGGAYDASGWVSISGIGLLAVWFAWLLHRTGSLIVPIVAHAVFNAIMLVLALFLLA